MNWIYFFGILAILGFLYYYIEWLIISKVWIIIVIVLGLSLLLFLLFKYIIPFIKNKKLNKEIQIKQKIIEQEEIKEKIKEQQEYIEKNNIYKSSCTYHYIPKENIKTEQDFYNEQLERCTKCEKVYYETLYKKYNDKYTIKAQVFLRSMFTGYGAENHKIDIVFFNKQTNKPELLIEINDYTHKDLLRKARDKDLKEFCNTYNIKLQFLYTKFGCTPKSIYRIIDKKLQE